MSSRKRNAPENNRVRRRRGNLHEIIVINDDEPENGYVADLPDPRPVNMGRRSPRSTPSPPRTSAMRGCWPFRKRKFVMMQGQTSRAHEPVMRSEFLVHNPPMFVNQYPYPPPTAIEEPVQLSQYRLENLYRRLPELKQCGRCFQAIPEGHPNYMPFMPNFPIEPSSDDDYEEALETYKNIDPTNAQELKEWLAVFQYSSPLKKMTYYGSKIKMSTVRTKFSFFNVNEMYS